MYRAVYVRDSSLYQNINPQEHDWQHFAACLIAQELSSTTLICCSYLLKTVYLRLHKFRNDGLYEGSA
jgi:hypothetical protein